MKNTYRAVLAGISSALVVGTFTYAAVAPAPVADSPSQGVMDTRENAKGSPVDLVERKCRDYAEGTIPGHAVVTLPGEDPAYVSSQVGFDLWGPDEQPATADDLPGILHAFCR